MHLKILCSRFFFFFFFGWRTERMWRRDGGGGAIYAPERCPGSQCDVLVI